MVKIIYVNPSTDNSIFNYENISASLYQTNNFIKINTYIINTILYDDNSIIVRFNLPVYRFIDTSKADLSFINFKFSSNYSVVNEIPTNIEFLSNNSLSLEFFI